MSQNSIPDLAKIAVSILLTAGAYAFSKGHPAPPAPELPRTQAGGVGVYCQGGVVEGSNSIRQNEQTLIAILRENIEYRNYERTGVVTQQEFKSWDVRQLSDTNGTLAIHYPAEVFKISCRSTDDRLETVCCAFLRQGR